MKLIIDPGHGGEASEDNQNTGAEGSFLKYGEMIHITERELALTIARVLRNQLKRRFDIEVIMTRNTDIYVPLKRRTDLAADENPDALISIHFNGGPATARGLMHKQGHRICPLQQPSTNV